MDVAVITANILVKLCPHHQSTTQPAFHLNLIKLLIEKVAVSSLKNKVKRHGARWLPNFAVNASV